jgi:PTS system galactitol-specific IIA component
MELVIDEKLILPNLSVESQNELFGIMGQRLIEESLVSENFIAEIIDREANYPTGLPTTIPISICHTDSKLVRKSFFTLTTLKNPIPFREMGNPDNILDVKIAFFLGIIEDKNHILFLRELLKVVKSEKILKDICYAKTENEIKEILSGNIKISNNKKK